MRSICSHCGVARAGSRRLVSKALHQLSDRRGQTICEAVGPSSAFSFVRPARIEALHGKQTSGEAEELIDLASTLATSRPEVAATAREVEAAVAAAVRRASPLEVELGFEAAARRLRAGWLSSVAAETSRVLRSPTESEINRLSRSRHDAYGYERDFQPESLERRCLHFFGRAPVGWRAAHAIFSSGQAALATLLLHLSEPHRRKLRVAHMGAYFETAELITRSCHRVRSAVDADCIIVEPVACDGRFATHDPVAIAGHLRAGQALVIDETLAAPRGRVRDLLNQPIVPGAVVLRLISGLKLLQQGLELANVGIVSIFCREPERIAAHADSLKRCRTLTGAGLRFVDALALEAPFFLDRRRTRAYTDRVFAHNAALARAAMARNRLFKPIGDIQLGEAAVPYCAFELRADNTAKGLAALADVVDREAKSRGLLLQRGGSFGFRGHRFEVIEPETGEDALSSRGPRRATRPFLRRPDQADRRTG